MFSTCILTRNSENFLPATLTSLAPFPEVILLDTGSTDQTIEVARSFPNVKIHQGSFTGFGSLRNQAAELASHDWILALDSDEVLSPALQTELSSLSLDPHCVYEFDFHNFYRGKRIRGCGWQPERHIRLYHRRQTRFSSHQLHEGVIAEGLRIVPLHAPILHTPCRSVSDFLQKMQCYSDLFAQEHQGRPSSFGKALRHGIGAFFRTYLLQRGFLMGQEGFLIALYNANTAFYKYIKLAEKNAACPPLPPH